MFLKNAWYCAGWDEDLTMGREALQERRIVGQSLLLYRKMDGGVVAMDDRCCHRAAPLSLGRKEGDAVRCMYHGMKFGPDGKCIEIPGTTQIPPTACVRTYPVVEKDNMIWIWMGSPDKADPALICDSIGPSDSNWKLKINRMRIDTDYRLEIANLADLSHVSWVHNATFGGTTDWAYIRPEHKLVDRGIDTQYCVRNVPAPAFAKHLFPDDARFDIQVHVRMSVPCNFILRFAVHEAGTATHGPTNGKIILDTFSAQAVTPRDADSIDYYYSWGTSNETYFPGITDLMQEANIRAFMEDKAMLEAQTQRMRETSHLPLVDIVHDAGPGRMLWVLDKMLAEEAALDHQPN